MTEPIDETPAGEEFSLEVLEAKLAAFDEHTAAAWLRVLAGTLLDVWCDDETLPEELEARAMTLTDVALFAIDRADQEIEPPLYPGLLPTGIEAAIVRGAHELAAMDGGAGMLVGRLLSVARGELEQDRDDEVERVFWMWAWMVKAVEAGDDSETPPEFDETYGRRFGVALAEGGAEYGGDGYVVGDVGRRAIAEMHALSGIDDEWSHRAETHFMWWAYRLPQMVMGGSPVYDRGLFVQPITARTMLVEECPDRVAALELVNALNAGCAMDALVFHDETGEIRAEARAVVHELNEAWIVKVLSTAAALQVDLAERHADGIRERSGGHLPTLVHSLSGPRDEPDGMLGIVDGLPDVSVPLTEADYRWILEQGSDLWVLASLQPAGITAEFAVAPDAEAGVRGTALLEVECERGSGVLWQLPESSALERHEHHVVLRLGFMHRVPPSAGAWLANALNVREAVGGYCSAPFLGAWSAYAERIWFTCRVPAVAFTSDPGVARIILFNLILGMGARAVWGAEAIEVLLEGG